METLNLITKKDEYIEYTNDLTREMDTYLKNKNAYMKTYVYDHSLSGKTWSIRYPGATRGHIEIDENNIITNIVLYKDNMNTHKIYNENIEECFKKYINMKLILE
jgi:hypothetical protein